MKKYLYSGLIFLICSPVLAQQSKKHAEVMKPIETVFKAMEIGDSALLGSAFYKKVALSTIVLDGSLELKIFSLKMTLVALRRLWRQ